MPHEVEAEAVHAVLGRPVEDAVDHQPLHHGALRRRVVHARGVLVGSALRAAVVVAGHALVKHALRTVGPAGVGVVVDDVQDHAQALGVQRLDHAPVLQHSGRAVGVCRVRSLGHVVEHRVVAPVEGVGVGRGHCGRLGRLRVLRLALGHRLLHTLLGALRDGAEVEGGQELHVRDARRGEAAQVAVAVRPLQLKGQVLALQLGGHARVGGAEVADVDLVDRGRGPVRQRRPRPRPPARVALPSARHAPQAGPGPRRRGRGSSASGAGSCAPGPRAGGSPPRRRPRRSRPPRAPAATRPPPGPTPQRRCTTRSRPRSRRAAGLPRTARGRARPSARLRRRRR
mmetsp:Transcript_37568/g.116747  ORF Transcript_37568/g.116747 Transcript_37568/m.116747 type:complete len:342 (-) Transcript_37568:462-1487(-)